MSAEISYCEPCLREDIKVNASIYCYECSEKLCEECKRHHKKSKSSATHKLIKLEENSLSPNFEQFKYFESITQCPNHSSEEVKYLCKDHDQLCCHECAFIVHRKCEDMVSLTDEVNKKKNSGGMKKRLEAVIAHSEKLIQHESEYVQRLDAQDREVRSLLIEFKSNLDRAYKQLRKNVFEKLTASQTTLSGASSRQKRSAEQLRDEAVQSLEKINQMGELGTDLQVYLMEKQMDKIMAENEFKIRQVQSSMSKKTLKIEGISNRKQVIQSMNRAIQIREVIEKPFIPSPPGHISFTDRLMVLSKICDLQEFAEPKYCLWVESCIVVGFDTTSKINVYSEHDGSLLSYYTCSGQPTSLTHVGNSDIAISLPYRRKIIFLKLDKNHLIFMRTLSDTKAHILAYNKQDKQVLALDKSENVIWKVDLYGKINGMLPIQGFDKCTFQSVDYFEVDSQSNRLYISSHVNSAVVCMDMSGKLVFRYEIPSPMGIAVDFDGNIYVVSWNSKEVHQVNKDGKLCKKLISDLETLDQPMAICFNEHKNKTAVTWRRRNDPGCIKIYNFCSEVKTEIL